MGDATMADHVRDSVDLVASGRVDEAPLPVRYERARTEIAAAASLDECAEWTSKASALASYARQAKDDSLLAAATRIKARAIRRSGELLLEIRAKAGGRGKSQGGDAAHHLEKSERAQAAKEAGLSRDQAKQAVRVAKVPAVEFEEAIESEAPPSIEELAERGTNKKPAAFLDLQGVNPGDFNRTLHLKAAMVRLAESLNGVTAADFLRGSLPSDRARTSLVVETLAEWFGDAEREIRK